MPQGVFVFRGVDFPYTHNISRLFKLCHDQLKWTEELQDAEELTPFAITSRYPGEDEEVSQQEAIRAIDIADHVRVVVRAALAQAVMSLSGREES